MITKKTIADKILSYLQHRLTLTELVEWSEQSLQSMSYADDASHTIRNVLAQLGLADVKAFGLEWTDCENLMQRLGFKLEVTAEAVA